MDGTQINTLVQDVSAYGHEIDNAAPNYKIEIRTF